MGVGPDLYGGATQNHGQNRTRRIRLLPPDGADIAWQEGASHETERVDYQVEDARRIQDGDDDPNDPDNDDRSFRYDDDASVAGVRTQPSLVEVDRYDGGN